MKLRGSRERRHVRIWKKESRTVVKITCIYNIFKNFKINLFKIKTEILKRNIF